MLSNNDFKLSNDVMLVKSRGSVDMFKRSWTLLIRSSLLTGSVAGDSFGS